MEFLSRPKFFPILTFLSLLVLPSTTPCNFPAIINFGDSNSDTGGLSAVFGQAPFPYGITFFHRPAGRYCDGRLVIDFIAQGLGLPYLSAFLDALGSNFSHGANFATAASTILPQNASLQVSGFSPISLNVQLDEFNDFQPRSKYIRGQGGVFRDLLPKEEYFSRALYTFDIGQNDLTVGYYQNKTTAEVRAYVPDLINKLTDAIKSVYDRGGRSFWIHNTGPVGCLAYMLGRFPFTADQIDNVGCASPFNEVAQYFNQKLKEAVVQLRTSLPHAALTYVDIYSIKYDLFRNPKKYGFVHPLRVCCGHGGKYNWNRYYGCGDKVTIKGKEVLIGKACKDPSKAVVWDGVHYTEAANKIIFNKIVNGDYSDPPTPLKWACHGY